MRIRINGENLIVASEMLLVLYLCLPITISLLNSLVIRGLVFFAAIFFILGLVLLNKWKYLLEFLALFLLTLLFWTIVWRRQYDSVSYIYFCFASLSFAFGSVVMYQSNNSELIRKLFILLTAIFTITAITTIIGLNEYPLAAREMARGSTYDTNLNFEVYKTIYRRMNIAGWSHIYGMLFAVPCSCLMWKKTRNKIYILILAIIEISIIMSQITFAVLLSLILIFAVIAIGENNTKTLCIMFFSLFLIGIISVNLDSVLTNIINSADDSGFSFLTANLDALRKLLVYKQVAGDAIVRSGLYKNSFDAFLDSPIVGAIFDRNVAENVIGRHSELLDILGGLGSIGLIGIILSIYGYFRFLKQVGSSIRKELIVIFLGFIALSLLNPVLNSPQVFVGAFLYAILCAKMCETGEEEKMSIFKIRFIKDKAKNVSL